MSSPSHTEVPVSSPSHASLSPSRPGHDAQDTETCGKRSPRNVTPVQQTLLDPNDDTAQPPSRDNIAESLNNANPNLSTDQNPLKDGRSDVGSDVGEQDSVQELSDYERQVENHPKAQPRGLHSKGGRPRPPTASTIRSGGGAQDAMGPAPSMPRKTEGHVQDD